jgi:hypothetical protein
VGASGWKYYTPYQPDINKALQELREEVFRSGTYHQRTPFWREISFEDYLPPDPEFTDEDRAEYVASFQQLQALQEPTSIETLLEWNGEDGTHSILDIDHIASDTQVSAVAPLSHKQLEVFFGTSQPTHEIIDRTEEIALYRYLQEEIGRYRSEATYIIVYKDSMPDEIFFIGYSGD